MTAERFTIGPSEKALVLGCRKTDLQAWIDDHPVVKERVIFWSEDEMNRKDSIPVGIKGVLFCRHLNHAEKGRIETLAKKNGIVFTKFFARSIELKSFLEMSVLVIKTVVVGGISPANDAVSTSEGSSVPVVELRKPKIGEVSEFIMQHADFETKHSTLEINRIFDLATKAGLKTTNGYIEVAFYRLRRLNKITDPNVDQPEAISKEVKNKAKGKKKDNILYKYLDSLAEFSNNSLMASSAIRELLAQVETFESELEAKKIVWNGERNQLLKFNEDLKKENKKLKSDFDRLASVFGKIKP